MFLRRQGLSTERRRSGGASWCPRPDREGGRRFRSGWFVESLTTQTLVIFVIRTRRVPFLTSRPSPPLLTATLACAATGVALPFIGPLARLFGFRPLPLTFLAVLAGMIITYLALAQLGVALFFKPHGGRSLARTPDRHERDFKRRALRWHVWPHSAAPPPPTLERPNTGSA
jgi:Mg2+-importing ATPase